MSWYLMPSGWPTFAVDGEIRARNLLDQGATVIAETDVQAAIDAYNAGVGAPNQVDLGTAVGGLFTVDGRVAVGKLPDVAALDPEVAAAVAGLASATYVDGKVAPLADQATVDALALAKLDKAAANATIDAHLGGDATSLLDPDGNIEQARQPSVFVATGGDDTAALNTFLAAASPLGVKKLVGTFTISGTLTMPLTNTVLDLSAATITSTSATVSAIVLTGDRAALAGGRITSPAAWDGTNTGAAWTFAVVLVTGADCTVRGLSLLNVPRVGIGAKDANGTTRILDCTVDGNYPAASWTEAETMHFGIGYDPGVTCAKLIAHGNTIRSCVQGAFLGNYGLGASSGSIILGNTFEGCHNHAVYGSASCTEVAVTSNTVVDCSRPVALTGAGHDVSHNAFTTTLASGNLAEVCGIQMRDAVDCTVSFNRMKGNVHASTPAVDLSRTGANTTVTGNRVVGNKIEVTGANTAVAIRVGTGAETALHGNVVAENNVKGPGFANQGLIAFFGANGAQGYSNKCIDNVITITGPAHGVYVSEMRGLDVAGNHVRLEYDAAAGTVLGGVYLTNNSTGTKVRHNDFECTSSYGANVTFRAVYEGSATVGPARIGPNRYNLDPTKLAGSATHVLQATSGSILDEQLPGAPATVCGPGSRWMRTDGGAGSTLYVKESAASSAVWRAV